MRKIVLVVLTTLALVLAAISVTGAVASAAAPPAYKVTLKVSKATSEAGKFVVVSGKVTGPKAAGRTVAIQRQYVGGAWTNVAFPVIRANGTFSARVETPRGGTTSFRAVKARSSVRKAGVSPTRAVKVYQWLYLASEAGIASENAFRGIELSIGGKTYRRSISFGSSSGGLTYKLGGACTQFAALADYRTTGDPAADNMDVTLSRIQTTGPNQQNTTVIASGTFAPVTSTLAGTRFLTVEVTSVLGGGQYFAGLGDPRVYCNAPYLPSFGNGDL